MIEHTTPIHEAIDWQNAHVVTAGTEVPSTLDSVARVLYAKRRHYSQEYKQSRPNDEHRGKVWVRIHSLPAMGSVKCGWSGRNIGRNANKWQRNGWTNDYDREWLMGTCAATWEEAQQQIRFGAPPLHLRTRLIESADTFAAELDSISRQGISVKRKRRYSLEGDELDIDRAMVGDPNAWITRKRGAKKKLIRVGIQSMYPGVCDEEDYIKAALRAVQICQVLERLGYAVEISAYDEISISEGPYTKYKSHTEVMLKRSSERLDAIALLVVGLPAFSRMFSLPLMTMACGNEGGDFNGSCIEHQTQRESSAFGFDVFIGSTVEVTDRGDLVLPESLTGVFRDF